MQSLTVCMYCPGQILLPGSASCILDQQWQHTALLLQPQRQGERDSNHPLHANGGPGRQLCLPSNHRYSPPPALSSSFPVSCGLLGTTHSKRACTPLAFIFMPSPSLTVKRHLCTQQVANRCPLLLPVCCPTLLSHKRADSQQMPTPAACLLSHKRADSLRVRSNAACQLFQHAQQGLG